MLKNLLEFDQCHYHLKKERALEDNLNHFAAKGEGESESNH